MVRSKQDIVDLLKSLEITNEGYQERRTFPQAVYLDSGEDAVDKMLDFGLILAQTHVIEYNGNAILVPVDSVAETVFDYLDGLDNFRIVGPGFPTLFDRTRTGQLHVYFLDEIDELETVNDVFKDDNPENMHEYDERMLKAKASEDRASISTESFFEFLKHQEDDPPSDTWEERIDKIADHLCRTQGLPLKGIIKMYGDHKSSQPEGFCDVDRQALLGNVLYIPEPYSASAKHPLLRDISLLGYKVKTVDTEKYTTDISGSIPIMDARFHGARTFEENEAMCLGFESLEHVHRVAVAIYAKLLKMF